MIYLLACDKLNTFRAVYINCFELILKGEVGFCSNNINSIIWFLFFIYIQKFIYIFLIHARLILFTQNSVTNLHYL